MFRIDGKFFGALSKLADLVILNILFLACCLPVVTIGASITALYAVTKKMAEDREGYIFKGFFISFKDNFKQSTIMWLILLVPIVIVSVDLNISNLMKEGSAQTIFKGFLLLVALLIWFSGTAYLNSLMLNKIFRKYM